MWSHMLHGDPEQDWNYQRLTRLYQWKSLQKVKSQLEDVSGKDAEEISDHCDGKSDRTL